MRQILCIALTAGLLSPTAAKAESHWLIIQFKDVGAFSSFEKVEMPSAEASEKEGRRWEDSPTQGDNSKFRSSTAL
tara:strand:+ start:327 stop:554 length:228 start_codon:yes stop_codon:yes gene_type:complete